MSHAVLKILIPNRWWFKKWDKQKWAILSAFPVHLKLLQHYPLAGDTTMQNKKVFKKRWAIDDGYTGQSSM